MGPGVASSPIGEPTAARRRLGSGTRRRNLKVALGGSTAVMVANGLYLLSTPDGPARPLLALVQLLAIGIGAAVVAVPGPVTTLQRVVIWVVSQNVLAVLALWLDGGLRSPLVVPLFVSCVLGALTVPRVVLHGILAGTVLGMLAVGLVTRTADVGTLLVLPTGLAAVALFSNSAGRSLVSLTRRLNALNDELSVLARTDPLTGCANHRSFYEALDAELARSDRRGSPTAVVLLDVDHFKRINDRYGHPTGDDVLVAVAAALARCIRQGDVLGRTGGEEFTVLLPDTAEHDARDAADRLRAAVSEVAGPEPLTVSAGVAVRPAGAGTGATALVRAADDALYAAKHAGRDRTVVHGDPQDVPTGCTPNPRG